MKPNKHPENAKIFHLPIQSQQNTSCFNKRFTQKSQTKENISLNTLFESDQVNMIDSEKLVKLAKKI